MTFSFCIWIRNAAGGLGAVADDGRGNVVDGDDAVVAFMHHGLYVAYGQLAAALFADDGCAGLGDVEVEVGAAGYESQFLHVHDVS